MKTAATKTKHSRKVDKNALKYYIERAFKASAS
jgi:hypothetical protein